MNGVIITARIFEVNEVFHPVPTTSLLSSLSLLSCVFPQASLKPSDLSAFAHVCSDPRAQHYSQVIQARAGACADRTKVRNHRYAALRALQRGWSNNTCISFHTCYRHVLFVVILPFLLSKRATISARNRCDRGSHCSMSNTLANT